MIAHGKKFGPNRGGVEYVIHLTCISVNPTMPHQGLSDRIKTVIRVELEAGLTPNAIEKANNVSVQTVRKYRRNLHENGSMSIPSTTRMGPPRALSLYIEELIS